MILPAMRLQRVGTVERAGVRYDHNAIEIRGMSQRETNLT